MGRSSALVVYAELAAQTFMILVRPKDPSRNDARSPMKLYSSVPLKKLENGSSSNGSINSGYVTSDEMSIAPGASITAPWVPSPSTIDWTSLV